MQKVNVPSRLIATLLSTLLVGTGTVALNANPSFAGDIQPSANGAQPPNTPEVMNVTTAQVGRDSDGLQSKIEEFLLQYSRDDSWDTKRAIDKIQSSITSGTIATHLPDGAGIAESNAVAWVSKSGIRLTFVPYLGTVVKPSGLTVAFNQNGEIARVSEAIYQPASENSGTVTTWTNGELSRHLFVNADGVVRPAATGVPPTSSSPQWGFSYKKFKKCLSDVLVVPSWVISGIAAACAVICAFTDGGGCIACAIAAATGWADEISYCAGYAGLR